LRNTAEVEVLPALNVHQAALATSAAREEHLG